MYDEVRRLAIAGSVVAPGDFRLKKLIAPLEQAGQKAPVFAKVAQAVTNLVASDERSSSAALLELSTLVNAILYTQGETGVSGELSTISSVDLGQQQRQTSARILKPLIQALTTKGSERLELIRASHEAGTFRDLRLVGPALAALDDVYGEIGDFIADKVLPLYGPAILPELEAQLDLKGRGGHVRRLRLLHKLDPQRSRDLVKRALEEGSKEMRIQAIACLGQLPEDLAFALEQARSRSKEVREAAFQALGNSDDASAVETLTAALAGNDLELVATTIRKSRHPQLLTNLRQQIEASWSAVVEGKQKEKTKREQQVGRLLQLLRCLAERDDRQTATLLLSLFEARDRLDAVQGDPGGQDVRLVLAELLVGGSADMQSALVDAHATLRREELGHAFVAACRCRPPADVFEQFSPYLAARSPDSKKKRGAADKLAQEKGAAIAAALGAGRAGPFALAARPWVAGLDIRWLDQAVERQDLELVQCLASPGHAGASRLLWEMFEDAWKKKKDAYGLSTVLHALIRCEHPQATDALIRTLQAEGRHVTYGTWWMAQSIVQLPKSAISKLEALLPSLPDRVADHVLGYLSQLKDRPD